MSAAGVPGAGEAGAGLTDAVRGVGFGVTGFFTAASAAATDAVGRGDNNRALSAGGDCGDRAGAAPARLS